MKKMLNVVMLMLAVNFIAIAGAVGYLKATDKIDRAKVMAIKDILFPPPATQPSAPVAAADPDAPSPATNRPSLRLEELLAHQSGQSAGEQVDFIRQSFDAQMAQLDRRQRELTDLGRQVDLAKQQVGHDRTQLDAERGALKQQEVEQAKLADDKGFQDSLTLYKAMPAKQAKSIFMTLDDKLVAQYLNAMEPRTATKIIKEFKSPEEAAFVQRVMERVRKTQQTAAAPATQPAGSTAGQTASTGQ